MERGRSPAVQIFYANNATNISAANAQTVAWVRTSCCQFDIYCSTFRIDHPLRYALDEPQLGLPRL